MRLLITLVALVLAGAPVVAEERPPLRVGAVLALTGAGHVWGANGRMALELALDELNASNLAGRRIQLILEDTKSLPASAVSAFRKLSEIDKVDFVIGDVWSMMTNPLIPIADRARVPLVSPTVMDASVRGSSPYFFTLGHSVSGLQEPVEKFLDLNRSIRTVAILCWEDAWGQAHYALWKRILAARRIKIIDESCQGDFTHDYKPEITRISRKKPDAVIIAYGPEIVARRMSEQNFRPIVLTTNALVEPFLANQQARTTMEGFFFTDWLQGPLFRERFKARHNAEPILEAQNHYEALRAVALASSLQNPGEPLVDAFRRVNFKGEVDDIDFTASAMGNKGKAALFRVRSGVMVSVP